jgi:hypothetical protein
MSSRLFFFKVELCTDYEYAPSNPIPLRPPQKPACTTTSFGGHGKTVFGCKTTWSPNISGWRERSATDSVRDLDFHLSSGQDSLIDDAVAGKGVKKNGMYLHDRAASFESLPPGPDPNSVPKDVHHYLPKLTKKSTFFRPSATTISQRIEELHDLICALLSDGMPALIKELRQERKISDFFGVWRRDVELAEKERRDKKKDKSPAHPRQSISSSVFSMYFPSSPSSSDWSTINGSASHLSVPPRPPLAPEIFP